MKRAKHRAGLLAALGMTALLLVTYHSPLITDFMSWKETVRGWTQRLDRALSLSDAQMGISSAPGAMGAPGGLLGTGAGGDARATGGLAMPAPVPADHPSASDVRIVETRNADGSTSIYGVPGTLITGGFLVQDEFNPLLAGREGVATYDRMRRTDSQVDATIELCMEPLLAAKWKLRVDESAINTSAPIVSSTGAGRTTASKAEEIRKTAEQNLFHNLGWRDARGIWHTQSWKHDVVRNALLMLPMGCAAHERVMRVDGNQLAFSRFADLPPKTFFRWDPEADGRTLRALIQLGFRGQWYGQVPVDAERLTLFSFRQEGADFWGRSMLRAAYSHYYAKVLLYRIRHIGAEKNSVGVPCITMGPNASAEDIKQAITYVTAIAAHQRTGLVLPNGATFELHGVKGLLFDSMEDITHHNEQISRVALDFFSNLGRGGKSGASGNRALQQGQGKFFQLALQNVGDFVSQKITDSDLRPWTIFNYGPDAPVPQLGAANIQSRGFEEVMAVLTAAAAGGLVVSDQPLRDQVREEAGFDAETRDGLVAVKGETIDLGSGVEISGRSAGAIDTGSGSQGGQDQQDGSQKKPAPAAPVKKGPPSATATRQKQHLADHPAFGTPPESGGEPRGLKAGVVLLAASLSKRMRTATTAYWPEPVHPSQAHIDFASLHQAMTTAETAIAQKLKGPAKAGAIARIARGAVQQLKAGARPSELAFPHDTLLESAIVPDMARAYAGIRAITRDEVSRQWRGRNVAPPFRAADSVRMADAGLNPGATKTPPQLVAEGMVQDVVNRFAAAARNLANDFTAEEIAGDDFTDDVFVNALHQTSDGFLDRAAAEASRDIMREARGDELDPNMLPGATWRRSALLDQNTCGPCAEADGSEIDGPDDGLSDICEGADACRCVPYADLTE